MDYQWLDEDEALRLCRSGDAAAYAVIVRRYQSEALRFAYLITGERGAAEDAAQDAFLNAYLNISRYDPNRPFRPWLYKILSNAALKKRRKSQPGPLDDNTASPTDPQEQAALDEQSATLQLALAQLPEAQRTALALKYYSGFSENEIATITRANVGTVKSRLHYGKLALERIIRERYPWLADEHSASPLTLNKEIVQ